MTKITIASPGPTPIAFTTVPIGSFFTYVNNYGDEEVWLKTEKSYEDNSNAVKIVSGTSGLFGDNHKITRVFTEITLR